MSLDSRELRSYLRKVEKNLGNIRPVLVRARVIGVQSAIANFRAGGRAPFPWAALKPSTKEARARKTPPTWPGGKAAGVSQPILNEFGTLFQAVAASVTGGKTGSFSRLDRDSVEFGTTLVKARGLQGGLPERSGVANVPEHQRNVRGNLVTVKAHTRRFRFGKLEGRPFMYWRTEDINEIMSIAFSFAFQPERARRFKTAPSIGSIPRNLFRGFG